MAKLKRLSSGSESSTVEIMDQMTYDEAESESTGDSAYCDNVTDTLNVTRLHGKSFEVTERQGQSALVPGVNIHKTPAESVSKSFTNSYKTTTAVENGTEVHNPSSADHTTVMNGKAITLVVPLFQSHCLYQTKGWDCIFMSFSVFMNI